MSEFSQSAQSDEDCGLVCVFFGGESLPVGKAPLCVALFVSLVAVSVVAMATTPPRS